jgi:hypothetical protein
MRPDSLYPRSGGIVPHFALIQPLSSNPGTHGDNTKTIRFLELTYINTWLIETVWVTIGKAPIVLYALASQSMLRLADHID